VPSPTQLQEWVTSCDTGRAAGAHSQIITQSRNETVVIELYAAGVFTCTVHTLFLVKCLQMEGGT